MQETVDTNAQSVYSFTQKERDALSGGRPGLEVITKEQSSTYR